MVMKKEFPTITVLSLAVCMVFYLLKSIVDVASFDIVTNPYVTLLGFSMSTFAVFVSEVKDLETFATKVNEGTTFEGKTIKLISNIYY